VVLGEGHGVVTRENFLPTLLNINNLGKAAVLHIVLYCSWGSVTLSLYIDH
jgi:hypothetical protein